MGEPPLRAREAMVNENPYSRRLSPPPAVVPFPLMVEGEITTTDCFYVATNDGH